MQKLKQSIPLTVSLFFIIFDYISLWCIYDVGTCRGTFLHNTILDFTQPAYIYALAALPIVFILPFTKEKIFGAWLRFAIPWLVLSILAIAVTPEYSSLYQPSKGDVSWYYAGIFTLTSFIIIFFGYMWEPLARRFHFMRHMSRSGVIAALAVFISLLFGALIPILCSGAIDCYPWSAAYGVPILLLLALKTFGFVALYGGIFLISLLFYVAFALITNIKARP